MTLRNSVVEGRTRLKPCCLHPACRRGSTNNVVSILAASHRRYCIHAVSSLIVPRSLANLGNDDEPRISAQQTDWIPLKFAKAESPSLRSRFIGHPARYP